MFGFVFGTACLVGFIFAARGRRRFRWGGGYGRGPVYAALARLDATPGQEKAIGAAFESFWETARKGRGSLKTTREAAAQAVLGAGFDESSLRGAFQEQDQALAEIREAALEAGRKIHEVLDERQRKILAEMIESGPGFGCGHRGYGHRHGGHGHGHDAYC
jgi:Spy/CpxP family protein refolding chaperone